MSNSLDPDQAPRFVGPDLGPNCLPRLSADSTGRQRVNKRTRILLNEPYHEKTCFLQMRNCTADKRLCIYFIDGTIP